jgi:hypothetical protein
MSSASFAGTTRTPHLEGTLRLSPNRLYTLTYPANLDLRAVIFRWEVGPKIWLLQFRVLGFGLFQDGDVGVGVFPEREEILIGGTGFSEVALHCKGAA